MTQATADELLTYAADVVERLERFAVTVLPPNAGETVALTRDERGRLVLDLEGRLPVGRRAPAVELDLVERWAPIDAERFEREAYRFELRHHGLGYRRAMHRHDVDHFVSAFDVATHEHCEVTMGVPTCAHYAGAPVADAIDAFDRLYDLWLTDAPPDCHVLRCLT